MMLFPLVATLACSDGSTDGTGDGTTDVVCADVPLTECADSPSCTPGVASLLVVEPASGRDCWTQERDNAVCADKGTFGSCEDVETAAAPPDDPTDCLLFANSCTPADWVPCADVPELTCPACVTDDAPASVAPDVLVSGNLGFGRALAPAGDTNGDGWQDILAGRKDGAVLLFGPFLPGDREVGVNDAIWAQEETDDRAGLAVAGLADLDGDGINDIAIGAPRYSDGGDSVYSGAVYVFKGPLVPGEYDLVESTMRFYGDNAGDEVGSALAFGKVTNDGLYDLLIGAPYTDTNGNDSGSIYVFAGPIGPGVVTMAKADIEIVGDTAFGRPFSVADVDGDDQDDLLMGQDPASATVLYGPIARGEVKARTGERLTPLDPSATEVSSIITGDLDNDGDVDLAWGAKSNEANGKKSGTVWTLADPWGGGNQTLEPTTAVNGRCEVDEVGQAVAIGDVTGDGIDDLLVGASGSDSARFGVAVFEGPVAPGELLVSEATAWLGDEPASALALMDLDNDGVLDIAAGNMDSNAVFIWFGGAWAK